MKKIVIIVVALLLLAGGGFAVWKFVLNAGKDEGGAGQEGHSLSDLVSSGPLFLELDPFIVPVIRENRLVKYLSLGIKLELTGSAAEAKVKEMMPYLRDAYLTRLHATLSRGDAAMSSDVPKLKRQLLAESEKLLGPGMVKDVLIEAVIEKEAPQQ